MRFHVIRSQTPNPAQSPLRVIEHETGREVGWVNRYLDREYVRRLADTTLRSCAYALLHFVRWWESLHHTGDVREADLTKSTLLDYLKFQCSHQPPFSGSTINDRIAVAERALRNEFPDAPDSMAPGFQQAYLRRGPLGVGRSRVAISRLRVRVPKRQLVPLSVEEVARFWSSFRTARDLAIVGLMLLHGLRSAEVLGLNEDDVLLAEVFGVNYFCPSATTIFPYQRQLPHSLLVSFPRASGELPGGGGRSPEPEGSSPEAVAGGRGRSVASSPAA